MHNTQTRQPLWPYQYNPEREVEDGLAMPFLPLLQPPPTHGLTDTNLGEGGEGRPGIAASTSAPIQRQ
ncbi:hypothetical protein EJ02DRAFT_450615 [Clathrospora elynae]|uniref:Uncharacterized protein n=1 Tax=Clathrospora elynae TaxID=706981 RepID=A0A6A5T1N1_9PLEO|nr:hypothetical protein EJ02DRAFT_450615 [Clathrospora elynae]